MSDYTNLLYFFLFLNYTHTHTHRSRLICLAVCFNNARKKQNNFVELSKLCRTLKLELDCQNFCSIAYYAYYAWDSYIIILIVQQNYFQIYI